MADEDRQKKEGIMETSESFFPALPYNPLTQLHAGVATGERKWDFLRSYQKLLLLN